MKYTLGVDVGLNGALAFYRADPLDIIIYDMPINVVTVNGKQKKRIDFYELSRIIDNHASDVEKAIVEQVAATPQMGVTSSFAFGTAAGIVHGVIAANFIPMDLIRPQLWKKHYGLNSDKAASRIKASSMFPKYADQFCRSKDDGRAEALLIAVYGEKSH